MKCGIMKNKLVLVTGGNKGIGKSIVKKLSKSGFDIAFTYNSNKEESKELEREFQNTNVKAYQFTLGKREGVSKLLKKIKNDFGALPLYLVNNAALLLQKDFNSIDDKEWNLILDTNLNGAFQLTQELIVNMEKHNFGRIVNISSIGGQVGGNLAVHYATSKAGLISFTKSMAKIYSKSNVLTNCITPGLVNTDMIKKELNTKAGKEKVESIPVGKITEPKEIARLCKFLLSKNNNTITGQTININGGLYFG